MRTYFIDNEKNEEEVVDLTKTKVHSSELIEFEFSRLRGQHLVDTENIFIRKLAGQYFVSQDNKCWEKIARQSIPNIFLNIDRVYDLYRGFKPSGLNTGNEGELLTQMPGKIVKILVKEGDFVRKGEALVILEAMKMENEIKAARDGVIKNIHVTEGDALEQGVLIMELKN